MLYALQYNTSMKLIREPKRLGLHNDALNLVELESKSNAEHCWVGTTVCYYHTLFLPPLVAVTIYVITPH